MCRSIMTLFNTDPPVTQAEIEAASLQFVRKISGYRQPSQVNQAAFEQAVKDIAAATQMLLNSLETSAPVRQREQKSK